MSPSALLQHVPSLRWKSTANSFVLPLGCRGPRSRTPWLPAGCGHRTRLWNTPLISLSSRSHAVTCVRWPWHRYLMDALIPFCSCVSLTQLCLLTPNATMQRRLHQPDADVVRPVSCFGSPTHAHAYASSAASITSYGPSGAHGLCKRRPSTDLRLRLLFTLILSVELSLMLRIDALYGKSRKGTAVLLAPIRCS